MFISAASIINPNFFRERRGERERGTLKYSHHDLIIFKLRFLPPPPLTLKRSPTLLNLLYVISIQLYNNFENMGSEKGGLV
jgi:hypothetical protein